MKTINIAINILFFKMFSLYCSHACVQVVFYIIAHNIERFNLCLVSDWGQDSDSHLLCVEDQGQVSSPFGSVHEMCGRQNFYEQNKISKCFWQPYWKVNIQNVVLFFSISDDSNSEILIISWFFFLYFPSRIYTSA